MGVLYHLRYPLFALDKVITKVAPGGRLVFQTMLRGSSNAKQWDENYQFWKTNVFADPDWPSMYFVERSYANDPTNWWIPNRAAAEAMLRSSGLGIVSIPSRRLGFALPKRHIARVNIFLIWSCRASFRNRGEEAVTTAWWKR